MFILGGVLNCPSPLREKISTNLGASTKKDLSYDLRILLGARGRSLTGRSLSNDG